MKDKWPFTSTLLVLCLLILAVGPGQAQELTPSQPSPSQGEGWEGVQATILGTTPSAALGTGFTYQGQLKSSGNPVNAHCDFQFSLWNAESDGMQVGTTQAKTNVEVNEGLFTVQLDFGSSAFTGDARWLAIAVRCPTGSGTYTALTPRQALTAAPYALYSRAAPWSGLIGVPAGFADGVDNDTTYTAGTGLTLAGTQFSLNTAFTDSRYWQLAGNSGTNPATQFLGTTDNQALELRVNNARALRLEPNTTSPNLIGGYSGNSATSGVVGAAIGGGGAASGANRVTDDYGTVGGGFNNRAGDNAGTTGDAPYATVGGGGGNTASGYYATVGGGFNSTASGDYVTVAGGGSNTASNLAASIGGGYGNTASGEYATVGGGYVNAATGAVAAVSGGYGNGAGGNNATISGGYSNMASGPYAAIGGGYDNTAAYTGTTVSGGWSNAASHDYAAVGGGAFNTASGPAATIGGGWSNTASGESASVGGGDYNLASAAYATIAGGGPSDPNDPSNTNNRVTDDYGTVGGGGGNRAGNGDSDTTNARYATVGGGINNTASSQSATVGGGWVNTASGNAATVPGGADNVAGGAYSFAAGAQAQATHDGSFVWSSTEATSSWGDNTFTVRAHGGARFYSAAGTGTGVQLASGSGSWSNLSDRAAKENLAPVDGRDVLDRLAAVPIQTWNYRSQDPAIRHIGPVAQDFYAAFGVGEDDTHITTVDADGVALAAIQGLYELSQEQGTRIAQLEGRVAALEARNAAQQAQIDDLEARLTALERQVGGTSAPASAALPVSGLALGGLALLGVVLWAVKGGPDYLSTLARGPRPPVWLPQKAPLQALETHPQGLASPQAAVGAVQTRRERGAGG